MKCNKCGKIVESQDNPVQIFHGIMCIECWKKKHPTPDTPPIHSAGEDLIEFPYEGACGKCGNYKPKLDSHFLCEFCLLMGVKYISMTVEQRAQVEKLVRLRDKPPTPQTGRMYSEGEVKRIIEFTHGSGVYREGYIPAEDVLKAYHDKKSKP